MRYKTGEHNTVSKNSGITISANALYSGTALWLIYTVISVTTERAAAAHAT